MLIQPYLSFEGRCDEAVAFYKTALGAEVQMLMRFKDAPDQSMMSPASADKVAHVSMRIGDSTVMASDGRCTGKMAFSGFSLSRSPYPTMPRRSACSPPWRTAAIRRCR